jgi:cytochrome P450 family 4
MPKFNENSRILIQRLRREVNKEFDVHDYMVESTVDVLLETVMGVKKKSEDSGSFKYAEAVIGMSDILFTRFVKLFSRFEPFYTLTGLKKRHTETLSIIHDFTQRAFDEKYSDFNKDLKRSNLSGLISNENQTINLETEKLNSDYTSKSKNTNEMAKGLRDDLDDIDEDIGEKKRTAFLDHIIETSHFNPNKITNAEVKQQIDTIMFEGHDTTAAASSFVLCMLGVHQNIQSKVYEEMMSIFGKSDRDYTYADTTE